MMNVSTLLPHSAPMPTRHRPNTKAAQAAATQADPRWAAVVAPVRVPLLPAASPPCWT